METALDIINTILTPKGEEENEPKFIANFIEVNNKLRVTLKFKGCEEIAASKDYNIKNPTRTEIYELGVLKSSIRGNSEVEVYFRMLPFGLIRLIDFSEF